MIFITGDMHGEHDIGKFVTKMFPEGTKLTKNDFVIITGDFGLFFLDPQDATDKYWLDWLDEKPWTTLFCRGNHDNPFMLEALPVEEMFGGKVGRAGNSIFFLRDGEIYTIEDKTFFVFGGALSTDRKHRTEGENWWREEIASEQVQEYALENLHRNNLKVDYVITHTAPKRIVIDHILERFPVYHERAIDPAAMFLDDVDNILEFGHWFFGHFHLEETYEDQYHVLYKNIIKL
jgi:predicted phosphohydrolase